MATTAFGWELSVERSCNWLLVKVGEPSGKPWEMPSLTDALRLVAEGSSANLLVLELDAIDRLNSQLIGQLVAFNKWIRSRDGALRLCGLSPRNEEVIERLRLSGLLSIHRGRLEAIGGP